MPLDAQWLAEGSCCVPVSMADAGQRLGLTSTRLSVSPPSNPKIFSACVVSRHATHVLWCRTSAVLCVHLGLKAYTSGM